MAKYFHLTGWMMILSLLLSACGSGTPTQVALPDAPTNGLMDEGTAAPDAVMLDTATPDSMAQETLAQDTMMETATPQVGIESPDWYDAGFVEATTGEEFRINDFEGKVVLVETMAIWCTTCRAQQAEIKALHEKLGVQEDLVSITLDIDPNENQDDLKAYVEQNGFDWKYAVAPTDVSREIGKLYGDQFLNPPSAPILIVDRHGAAHPLPFGVKSADDLFEAVNKYLGEL
jgi:thiol-disulfide isomerase/thioredoxin